VRKFELKPWTAASLGGQKTKFQEEFEFRSSITSVQSIFTRPENICQEFFYGRIRKYLRPGKSAELSAFFKK
jgi:hypothetical protein